MSCLCISFLQARSREPGVKSQLKFTHSSVLWWRNSEGKTSYNPFESGTYEYPVDQANSSFKVQYGKNDYTPYFITFEGDGGGGYQRILVQQGKGGNGVLSYQLYASSGMGNILKELPQASASNVIEGMVEGDVKPRTQGLNYYMVVFADQLATPGLYEDDVDLRLYKGTVDSPKEHVATRTVRYRVKVDKEAHLAVAVEGGTYVDANTHNLNFGQLEEGKTKDLALRIRSNTPCLLKVKSLNRGKLFHFAIDEASEAMRPRVEVPYELNSNGTVLDLSTNRYVELTRVDSMTESSGIELLCQVIIGDTANKFAGSYGDTLLVELVTE